MARREKFGKLVLLSERHSSPLGVENLAVRLGPDGLDRLVSVLRYRPEVSSHPEAVRRLTDEARRTARLHDSGLVRLLGVGNVGSTFYVSFEHIEGQTLAAIIERCRADRFPFSADNALLVVSRAATTLDFLHGRKDESGRALFHGLLAPRHVLVSYAGEVKVTGLGVWPGLRETGLIPEADRLSLAPEQRAGGEGDARSDIYSLGLLLLEMLTLERPSTPVEASSLSRATMIGPTGDPEPIPAAVAGILRSALDEDPEARYSGVGELRNVVDALLFSGDLSSTTFNLAFFMHTLFRQDVEREAAEIEEARGADYSEFLVPTSPAKEGPSPAPIAPVADAAPTADLAPASTLSPESATGARAKPTTQPASGPGLVSPTVAGLADSWAPTPAAPEDTGASPAVPLGGDPSGDLSSTLASGSSGRHRRPAADPSAAEGSGPGRVARRSGARGSAARIGAAGKPTSLSRRGLVLVIAALLAVVLGGGLGYVAFLERPAPTSASPPPTLTPQAAAALQRVRELEARIAELEREKAAADESDGGATPEPATGSRPAAGEARSAAPDEQARAREAARAEARRRAQVERERREAELRELEEEMRAAEARLVLEQQVAPGVGAASPLLPTVAPPPPTPSVPIPTPTPVEKGSLVDYSDPEVIAPVLLKGARVVYPPVAERARREGAVVVEVLIDETGKVAEARVVEPASSRMGFEDAALRMVRSRHYRPATKRGVPVKVRVRVRVDFTLAE